MGARQEAKARTFERILAAARSEVAEHGGVGLSMRGVARASGIVSSAVYRYFPTRRDLLTAMIVESYGRLAEALDAVASGSPAAQWRDLATALRRWARAHPHEFQLVYGTPVPGYVAPPETIPAATAVARPFLAVAGRGLVGFPTSDDLLAQFTGPAASVGIDAGRMAAVTAELTALIGFVSLELAGHFLDTAEPADPLYSSIVERQVHTLGLAG